MILFLFSFYFTRFAIMASGSHITAFIVVPAIADSIMIVLFLNAAHKGVCLQFNVLLIGILTSHKGTSGIECMPNRDDHWWADRTPNTSVILNVIRVRMLIFRWVVRRGFRATFDLILIDSVGWHHSLSSWAYISCRVELIYYYLMEISSRMSIFFWVHGDFSVKNLITHKRS